MHFPFIDIKLIPVQPISVNVRVTFKRSMPLGVVSVGLAKKSLLVDFVLLVLVLLGSLQGCSFKGRDRFALTPSDIDTNDLTSVGEDYSLTSAVLGTVINGHGLTEDLRTFMVVHKTPLGKPELVWPAFAYGQNQANIVVLSNIAVYNAALPDGQIVLMAHHTGEVPMVISPAVLRLAGRRLGTSIIQAGIDYSFSDVQLPPDRVWLKGAKVTPTASNNYKPFTVELTLEELVAVMNETRNRGSKKLAKKFAYLAESGPVAQISEADAREIAVVPPVGSILASRASKGHPYRPENERLYGDALLDPKTHILYFSTFHKPARILKVALGNDTKSLPVIIGSVVLEPEEDNTFNSAIDAQAGYAYFATDYPGHIVKVALGNSSEPPYRIGSVLLDEHNNVRVGVVDSAAGYGCFSIENQLFKIKLGKADEMPTLISRLELPGGRVSLHSSVIDPTTHCAYFGSDWIQIYKIDLGEGDSPMRFVNKLTLPDEESGLRGALIDPKRGCAWFASNEGILVKVALGGKDQPLVRLGSLKLEKRFRYFEHTFGMDDSGYAYFGAQSSEDNSQSVVKIALGKGDDLPRLASYLRLKPGEDFICQGIVDSATRTLCLGIGAIDCSLVKIALGQGDEAPSIIGTLRLNKK